MTSPGVASDGASRYLREIHRQVRASRQGVHRTRMNTMNTMNTLFIFGRSGSPGAGYLDAFRPATQAASVFQSGSSFEANCQPPE